MPTSLRLQLAPSILSCDPSRFADAVSEMIDAGVDWIHFDVMDGQFVPPITFGADLVRSLRKLGDTPFEVHLMTLTPEAHFQPFIDAGCSRVIFHAEATPHAHRLAQTLRRQDVGAGIAINPGTSESLIEPLLPEVDLVLVMTVNPGWGGQRFLPFCLEKVRRIRALAPDIDVEVDGGIDPTTIQEAAAAGANLFVTGSYLSGAPTMAEGVEELRRAWA
jgi:ribulose-phosphate 3-epimerase